VARARPDEAAGDRRETLEALSLNAAGTASAQASYCRQVRPTRAFRNKPASVARGTCSRSYVASGISRFAPRSRMRGTGMGSF
jgi:hypothetical protein